MSPVPESQVDLSECLFPLVLSRCQERLAVARGYSVVKAVSGYLTFAASPCCIVNPLSRDQPGAGRVFALNPLGFGRWLEFSDLEIVVPPVLNLSGTVFC